MDLNYLLVWFVGIGCLATLWSGLRARDRFGLGRVLYAVVVLALTLAVYFLRPDIGGFVGLALFAILIILPGWGMEWMWQAARAGRFTRARILSLWLRLMHPFLNWQQISRQIQIEEYFQAGRVVQVQQLLQNQAGSKTPEGIMAAIRLYQMNGDWRGAIQWLDANIDPALYARHYELVTHKIRALGETGALNEMVAFFGQYREVYRREQQGLNQALMIMTAFTGRPENVAQYLDKIRPALSPPVQTLWLATAHMAAGETSAGRDLLVALPPVQELNLQQSIQRRLHHGVAATAADMSPEAQEVMERLVNLTPQQTPPSPANLGPVLPRPVITYMLIVLNVLTFILELSQGGSENPLTLYLLGALNPQAVLNGEWWRLLTSMFLHAGLLHLLFNMYILYRVGSFMEYALGKARYTVLYLLAGLGSGLILVALALLGIEEMDLLAVGASGAIMGLIGAEAALWIKVYRQTGDRQATQRLRSLALFFIIQTAFDLSTPQVSFPAHFGGLVTGFFLGAFLQTGRTIPWVEQQINHPEPAG